LLVFVEKPDKHINIWIDQLAAHAQVPCFNIDKVEQAIEFRDALVESCNGIMKISTEFCRGYDLKLMKDAYVLVIANGQELTVSKINQMLGRGNRSQGRPEGCLVMFDQINIDVKTAVGKIRSRDKTHATYGYRNLELLANHKVDLRGSVFEQAKVVYGGNDWQVGDQDFFQRYKKLTNALKSVPEVIV